MQKKINMKFKSSVQKPNDYYNVFPEIRDFYLLDKEENIKNFRKTNLNDPEYIFVIAENEKKEIHENIYKRKDFIRDYDIVKIETKNPEVYINCLIPKIKFNIGREARLLTEIKTRPLFMKEILKKYKINLNIKKDIAFKEVFNIPTEKRFYNKIFTLHFLDRNEQSQNNDNNNTISNNINGTGSNIYNNFNNNGFYNTGNNNKFENAGNNKDYKNILNNNNSDIYFDNNSFNLNGKNNEFNKMVKNKNVIDNANNNDFRIHINNNNTNEKVHLKGHTGFF